MTKNPFRTIFSAIASATLICSILFVGWSSTDALTNPIAGKPLSFDKMLPYLSEGQPIYRGGKGHKSNKTFDIVMKQPNTDQNQGALKSK